MRLIAVLLVAAAVAPGLSGQDAPMSPLALPIHGGRPGDIVERPADIVARLARQALAAPGDTATWNALATALPAMAINGGADLEGIFEAARVADSLSAAAGVQGGPEDGSALLDDVGETSMVAAQFPGLPIQVGFGLALGALTLGGILWFRARRRGRRSGRSGVGAPVLAAAGRLWTARTLAIGGVAVPEIAKRTGMAQEAVNLALSLAGPSQPQPARARRPSKKGLRSGAPFGADGAEARLQREVAAAASRLKDKRLTYGGIRS